MLYSKQEYSLTNKSVSKQAIIQMQSFLSDTEEVLYTFDNNEVLAFFTSKKLIFVCTDTNRVYETEVLPYQSINRCTVIGLPEYKHGKLELVVSDEIVITFYLPEYADAVKLCHTVLKQ